MISRRFLIFLLHFRYWDPYYYRRRRLQTDDNDKMNFVESVKESNTFFPFIGFFFYLFFSLKKMSCFMDCRVPGFLICIWGWWSKSRNWRRKVEVGNILAPSSVVCYIQCIISAYLPIFLFSFSLFNSYAYMGLW